jgi:hypothetical protein
VVTICRSTRTQRPGVGASFTYHRGDHLPTTRRLGRVSEPAFPIRDDEAQAEEFMSTDQTREPVTVSGGVPRPAIGAGSGRRPIGVDDVPRTDPSADMQDTGRLPVTAPDGPPLPEPVRPSTPAVDTTAPPAEATDLPADPADEAQPGGERDALAPGGADDEDAPAPESAKTRRLVGGAPPRTGRRRIPTTGTRRARTRVLFVLVAALVGSALALTGSLLMGPRYTSEAGVLWDPASAQLVDETVTVDPNLLDRQVTDQQDVIASDAVVGAVSENLGMDPEDVRDAISSSVADGSSLITISAEAATPTEAEEIAAAVTTTYVDFVRTSGAASLTSRAEALQTTIDRQNTQLTALQQQLQAQTDQLAGVPTTSSTYAVLQGQVAQLSGQVADLTTRVADVVDQQESLRAAAAIYPGTARVLSQAEQPKAPSTFSVPVTVALGAILGLAVAGCVIGFQVARSSSASREATTPSTTG